MGFQKGSNYEIRVFNHDRKKHTKNKQTAPDRLPRDSKLNQNINKSNATDHERVGKTCFGWTGKSLNLVRRLANLHFRLRHIFDRFLA